ncbi:hypothetical protein LWI28_015088 [Acer negundo]|uniref:Reverse transcriptase RNase H-like domain-containing protein n=1 Tax=Acer negundo TaxID=4023 RepID=A0AAD5NLT5_ACENE|nr:hypothetical protein LWI28_015088 [Acer negundo]
MIERLCKGGVQCFAVVNDGDRQKGKSKKKNTNELQDELQRLPEKVRKVVANHRQVLEVPTSLPSSRHCDHRITLKYEAKPINVPLYRKFTIITDQQALRHLLEHKIVTPEQQKFLVKLLGFEYDIVYQPGKENKVANALSRKEGSSILWSVYADNEAGLLAFSGAK